MKFEHLIEINDLRNTVTPVFTRNQLWNGLIMRAEFPQLFLPNLDVCKITSRNDNEIKRDLRFGELIIRDIVKYDFLNFVHYQVPRQGDIPTSSMRMAIEEPAPTALFVRFSYDSGHSPKEDKENELYDQYRRSAYLEADIDMIKILREMHSLGRLNNLPS